MGLYGLVLLGLVVTGVYSDSHTLKFIYAVYLNEDSLLPEATVIRYLDDREIFDYDAGYTLVHPANQSVENNGEDDYHNRPANKWVEKNGDYHKRKDQAFRGRHPICKYGIKTAMMHFNKTRGFQTFQLVAGCELRDNGTTSGYSHLGYGGKDFAYLDMKRSIWIPVMSEAYISTQEWNMPNIAWGEMQKNFLEYECIERLKKYIMLRREELEKRVRPEVKVRSHHHCDGMTRLSCLVYGFQPRPVDVKWMKNGKDLQSDEMSPILPHPDGTYQIRVSVVLPTEVEGTYSCHVNHSSLDKVQIVDWEPSKVLSSHMTAGIVVGVCVPVVLLIIGAVVWLKKRKHGCDRHRAPDGATDNSNERMMTEHQGGNSAEATKRDGDQMCMAERQEGNSAEATQTDNLLKHEDSDPSNRPPDVS